MEDPATHDDTARTPFAAFIQRQRNGGLHGELTEAMADLVQDVIAIGKPGSLTLAVKVAPTGDGVTVNITDKITAKSPEPNKGAAIFFVDQFGNLTRNDPRQLTIDKPVRAAEAV